MDKPKTPGQRIASLRSNDGLSQKELAEKIHVSRDVVAKWESDSKRSIPNDYLVSLAKYFDVSTDYLLRGTKAKKLNNITIVDKYGLSESALNILEDLYSRQKHNSITLTLNALIEHGYVLGAISKYLYYNLETTHYGDVVPYRVEYRYQKDGDDGGWGGAAKKHPIDAGDILEAVDNKMYKKMLLLEIQEQLLELLKVEDKKGRF